MIVQLAKSPGKDLQHSRNIGQGPVWLSVMFLKNRIINLIFRKIDFMKNRERLSLLSNSFVLYI